MNHVHDLYIYYKVAERDAAALLPRVRAMQARLAAASQVQPQLKGRAGHGDGLQTWMEVYPGVAAGFAAALASAVADAGVIELTSGPRHSEVFMDVIPCA